MRLTMPDSLLQKASEAITSPPARVISAFMTVGLIVDLRVRTEPSPKRTFAPSGVNPPICGRGNWGSNGMSSGFVQGTSRFASTARIVFDNPSVTSVNEGLSPLPRRVCDR